MSFLDATLADFVGALLGFTLTLCVFSYVWGDNPFFRIGTHLFIGVAAGYATITAIYYIILPQLVFPLIKGNQSEMILAVIYLIPSALILTKISPRLSKLGNPAMAILVGIGAAAAVGGSMFGTIIPQVTASTHIYRSHNFLNASVILLGTFATLIYFHFGTWKKPSNTSVGKLIQRIGWIGQIFISITFSAIFAGVFFAALTALIERLSSIWIFIHDISWLVFAR